MKKPWYKSRGIWLGVVQAMIASLTILAGLLDQTEITVAAVVAGVIGVCQIWERMARGDLK